MLSTHSTTRFVRRDVTCAVRGDHSGSLGPRLMQFSCQGVSSWPRDGFSTNYSALTSNQRLGVITPSRKGPGRSIGLPASVVCYAVASPADVEVRPATTRAELQQAARLRAEAYYEEDRSRFVETFKRQFAAQEVESLLQRTTPQPGQTAAPCECLVAISEGEVVGCIDIRLPAAVCGAHPQGVPKDDARGCYILNVVVGEEQRGQGVGKALMRTAMSRAVRTWASEQLYTHVEADNEVACRLYRGCGFDTYSVDADRYGQGTDLGKLLLLRATADKAQ
mmetsp:Transcript_10438/g.22411  ORF Transcript_10438/g.22411 Transcript_10438/m.22411 type:complete len:279 (-) Transcript_10438:1086-1922(-)|eukprot:CAMPEP_0202897102 /NCGR_PEP_ID=MMETSP1392-20130828/5957_1 /ASSEMBLY_ACC=CAM_ASM_000868 /TAXON_ID=225041 /ORGANISM="Chlamydomonas chlamydogama, Strain SAG 11-48b" /LENGTH=278 /DNA_ID=CAMNT_0049582661 /DNA_START=70 /DNA_END=906 /DNA_ORIENTATION=-